MEPLVRSSVTSIASSASSIIDDSDPVTRDCHALRQRLLETERSLQNLTLKSSKVSVDLDLSKISCPSDVEEKESLYPSDDPPVLTLADLTPTNSRNMEFDTNLGDPHSEELFPRHSSFNDAEKKDDSRTSSRSQHSHGSNRSLNSTGSDIDVNSLRRKMTKLREENVSLFCQNNKLLAELEKTSFQLQESKSQVKELGELIEENQHLKESDCDETIRMLNEQIGNKDYAIRELEDLVLELRNHVRNLENGENPSRLKEKVEENLKTIEELTESCQSYSKREKKLQDTNQELEELKANHEKKVMELEDENSLLREENGHIKTDFLNVQGQLATLKTELLTLQQRSSQGESLSVENTDLKNIVREQQAKLSEYEVEVSKTKDHMTHLEKLIMKIQEERMANSRPDSGLGGLISEYTKFHADNDASSQRAVIADLQLKLAMKDTELHKLQVQVASNALHQQKLRSEFSYEGSTLHDLRAELCAVVEKTRLGDKKQMQLEQQITKLEEDLSGKKCQIIEMNERISDKVTLITTLENKLVQRNRKLVELQKELEETNEKSEKLKEENSKLSVQANEYSKTLLENESKIKDLEFKLNNANKSIAHYSTLVKSHEEDTHETDTQFENVKKLHSEHCKEYEYQIDNLQKQVFNKSNHVVTLESKLRNLLNEEKGKVATLVELKEYIQKMEQLLEEKKCVIEKYQENLESIQEHSKTKSQHVSDLQASLEQYKKDLSDIIKQHQDSYAEQEDIINVKNNQIESLTAAEKLLRDDIEAKYKRIDHLELSHNQNIEMLEQSQHRISELEESQSKYEQEMSSLKQTTERDRAKSLEEVSILNSKLQEDKKQLTKYKNQLTKMSDELNTIRSNHLLTSAKMKEQELKLVSQSEIIKKKSDEVDKVNNTSSEIEKYLREKENEIRCLEDEVASKKKMIDFSVEAQNDLAQKLKETQAQLQDTLQKLSDLEKEFKEKQKVRKDEAIRKMERMLTISQENLTIKENELLEYKERCSDIEKVMNEQQRQLKQKATEFAQLEMVFKNEKSEFEKKMAFLADDINGLKSSISQKDAELLDLTKSCESLKIRDQEKLNTIEIYEKKFKILEDENNKRIHELKDLSKELERCKVEIKNTIAIEEQLNNLKNENRNVVSDLHTLENQLMASQQTVLELNQELSDATTMIQLKEADCTRLARELGASQVREAQVNARLNQDLRKVVIEEGLKSSQKNNEIELLRNKINELSSNSQQEIMQLKHNLQRSEDEKILYKHDLERYNAWINELEQNGKTLNDQLQKERRKCKSLSESVILHEAKAARYSTRMSGYQRAAMTQTKISPRSTVADISMELDSTISTLPRETKPSKDSFDNLLKETEAELDNRNRIQNSSMNSSPNISLTTRHFDISSFDAT